MNRTMMSLLAGASMLGCVATAGAAERLSLTNSTLDGLRAGGWRVFVDKSITDKVWLDGKVHFYVKGRTAQANADAAFDGDKGFAFTGTDAYAGRKSGYSTSFSTAHSQDAHSYYYGEPGGCCKGGKGGPGGGGYGKGGSGGGMPPR
jgi:hypothetical protein